MKFPRNPHLSLASRSWLVAQGAESSPWAALWSGTSKELEDEVPVGAKVEGSKEFIWDIHGICLYIWDIHMGYDMVHILYDWLVVWLP